MKILIRFILLISLFLIPSQGNPCSFWVRGEDIRVYLFSPTAGESEVFTPFFYTSRFMNNKHYDTGQIPNENLDEWHNYFNEKVDRETIKELIYNTSFDTLDLLVEKVENNNGILLENQLAKHIVSQQLSEVAKYLQYTKKTENLIYENDPWESKVFDIELVNENIAEGKKRVSKADDLMLKQRYAYHVVVQMRYLGAYQEAIGFYEKMFSKIASENESIIKYWALSHVAFCQEELGMENKAHLNYARVFLNCHAKKNWVYNNMSKKSALSVLNLSENDADKYAIYTFSEFKNPGRAYGGLKKIAAMNPNTEIFKTLMIREVNKIEDWILTRRYTKYEPSIVHEAGSSVVSENYKSDIKYLNKFIGFLEKLILSNQLKEKAIYELILAYLYFVQESPEEALVCLNKAEKNIRNDYEKYQLRMTRILIHILFAKKYDAKFEELIWKDLQEIVKDEEYMASRDKNISNLMLALQQAYHKEGKYDRAALFMAWASGKDWGDSDFRYWGYLDPFFYLDKYASVEQVKSFYTIYTEGNNTNIEAFLLKDYHYSKNRYLDLIGTKYMREDQLEKALETYRGIPTEFWSTEFYYSEYLDRDLFNPEFDALYDNLDEYVDARFVNKAYLVQELIHKKKAYRKAKKYKRAELAYDLGNGYYNLSRNGSHWHCLAYIKSSSHYSYFGESNIAINDNYQSCNTALDYFKEAYELTKNAKYMTEEEYLMRRVIYATANLQTTEVNQDISKHWQKCLAEVEEKHPSFYKMMLEECASLGN